MATKVGKTGLGAGEINTPIRQGLEFLCQTFGYEMDAWERAAYERTLKDISADILAEAAQMLVDEAAAGRKFYPLPKAPDWKAAAAKVLNNRRKAAQLEQLKNCQHLTGHWREVIVNGVTRMARCECWEAGKAAADRIGAPLELPAVASDEPWGQA